MSCYHTSLTPWVGDHLHVVVTRNSLNITWWCDASCLWNVHQNITKWNSFNNITKSTKMVLYYQWFLFYSILKSGGSFVNTQSTLIYTRLLTLKSWNKETELVSEKLKSRIYITAATFPLLEKRTVLFWVITQWAVVISYWRFGATYLSHLQGSVQHNSIYLTLLFILETGSAFSSSKCNGYSAVCQAP